MRSPRCVVITGALVALLVTASPGLAGNGGFAPVPPVSPNAEKISQTYYFVSAFCLVVFLLVEGLLIAFVLRYRRRKRPRHADGAQIHGATRLELAWTIGPVAILAAIATFVFVKLPGIEGVPTAAASEENLVVDVTGTQFTWEFRYPNGVFAIDRLRAPQGRVVELRVTAPDWDVIHSWWIPALGGKIDAIPGTVNTIWFDAQKSGVFEGQCAELCGLYHAKMLAAVEVMPESEFDAWLEERSQQQAAGTSPLGEELWEGSCAKCHGLTGEGDFGPRLAGTGVGSDEASIERIVRQGLGEMPPVGRGWSETEMNALIAYLEANIGN